WHEWSLVLLLAGEVELAVGDALAGGLLEGAQDHAQVVDAGGFGERPLGLGDLGMDMPAEAGGGGLTDRHALEVDGDPAEVLGVVAELDLPTDQGGIDLVAVAEQADAGGPVHPACAGPAERLVQELGVDARRRAQGLEAGDRGLSG